MPKIDKIFSLEVTPEQFLQACSPIEIYEIFMQLQSPRYQKMIDEVEGSEDQEDAALTKLTLEGRTGKHASKDEIKKMLEQSIPKAEQAYRLLKKIRDNIYEFESLEYIDSETWDAVDKLYE